MEWVLCSAQSVIQPLTDTQLGTAAAHTASCPANCSEYRRDLQYEGKLTVTHISQKLRVMILPPREQLIIKHKPH